MKTKDIFKEARYSLNLAAPLVLSFIVQMLTPFFGTLMVAHLGQNALAARGLGAAFFQVTTVFFFSIFGSVGILVSQSYGAKDPKGVQEAVSQAFKLALLLSLPIMALMWISPFGLYLTNQSPKIIHMSMIYTWLLSLAILPYNILVVIEQFLIGIQKTKIVLIISVLQVPFEILVLYAFIFGKLGMPKMGVTGIGVAYVVVWSIASLVLGLFILKSEVTRKYQIFSKFWRFHPRFLKELFRVGWPIGVNNMIETGMFSMVILMMSWFSTMELAAYQIARQFTFIVLITLFAIVRATMVRVGQAVGMKDKKLIVLSTYVNMAMTVIWVLGIGGLVLLFSKQIIGLDINIHISSNKNLFHFAQLFLGVTILSVLIESVRLNIVAALRGMKDTRYPMYISFVALWLIGLPIGYVLGFGFGLRGVGLLWGGVCGFIVATIILFVRYYYLLKRINLDGLVTLSD